MQKPYEAPFEYDPEGQIVWDKNRMWSLTIRGWGALTGVAGGTALSEDEAARIQDEFGERVVRLLNEDSANA
jgi:hypothetical protein